MRLFLALDLPPGVRAGLGGIQATLAARNGGWRWLSPESMHLTLRFLGDVSPEADRDLRGAWRSVARPFRSVRFRLGGTGVFPGLARPRILWIGVHEQPPEGNLEALASALEAGARERGFPAEDRPFRPHLTLARARGPGRPSTTAAAPWIDGVVECREVVLFESRLGASGARYAALEAFPLDGAPS